MAYANPKYLIDPASLASKLGNTNLRIFDAAVHLKPNPAGGYRAESGLETYTAGHVPGAAFLDQINTLSDTSSPFGFTRLPDDELIQAFADAGIDADSDVVLYSSGHTMWATRAWWLLHYCGHQCVAILDGGLQAWQAAGQECSIEANQYTPAHWQSSTLAHRFVDKQGMVEAMGDAGVCTVNALSPAVYAGTGEHHYGRRGHIPSSINVFYDTLLNEGRYRTSDEVRALLEASGMLDERRVVAYCGGGISATIDAFACLLLGKQDVAVYDGSMSEWVSDATLPLVEGEQP